jgi:hypothetical protein
LIDDLIYTIFFVCKKESAVSIVIKECLFHIILVIFPTGSAHQQPSPTASLLAVHGGAKTIIQHAGSIENMTVTLRYLNQW